MKNGARAAWRAFSVPQDSAFSWEYGAVCARFVRSVDSHWTVRLLLHNREGSEEAVYNIASGSAEARFEPFLENMPFLACFAEKLLIEPDWETAFSIELPCSLRLLVGRQVALRLSPYSCKLSFEGDTVHGDLCAVLPLQPVFVRSGNIENGSTNGFFADQAPEGNSFYVKTGVIIRNRSKQVYETDSIIIYPETLDIFEKNGSLAASIVIIDYAGGEEFRLQTLSALPADYTLLTRGAKDGMGARLIRRGAGFIKDITLMKLP